MVTRTMFTPTQNVKPDKRVAHALEFIATIYSRIDSTSQEIAENVARNSSQAQIVAGARASLVWDWGYRFAARNQERMEGRRRQRGPGEAAVIEMIRQQAPAFVVNGNKGVHCMLEKRHLVRPA